MKLYIKVFAQFLFYLIGTFLHEAAHWIGAMITFSRVPRVATVMKKDENGNSVLKEVAGFTIIPKISDDYVTYGHVVPYPLVKASYIIIATAPLIWFVVLYYMLTYYDLAYLEFQDGSVYGELDYKNLFSFNNWYIVYISLQLIWAGTLSSQDIKMAIKGVFSLSFLIIALLLTIVYQFTIGENLLLNTIGDAING